MLIVIQSEAWNNADWFAAEGLDTDFKEFYYSVSHRNVIRGMHFQLPPHEHSKLVYVSKGSIVNVVLDLRKIPVLLGNISV